MQEYLVLGGKHHGEVWRGVYPAMGLNLSKHDERFGQFYDTPICWQPPKI